MYPLKGGNGGAFRSSWFINTGGKCSISASTKKRSNGRSFRSLHTQAQRGDDGNWSSCDSGPRQRLESKGRKMAQVRFRRYSIDLQQKRRGLKGSKSLIAEKGEAFKTHGNAFRVKRRKICSPLRGWDWVEEGEEGVGGPL